jgi:DNA-directed RNA polymerase subunit beta'
MSKTTTVGKILLKHYLPKDLHEFIDNTELDAKGIGSLFSKLAEGSPEVYKDSVSHLTRLGFEVSTRLGSTVKLTDLISPVDKEPRFKELEEKVNKLKETEKNPRKLHEGLANIYGEFTKQVDKDIVELGVKKNQTLAKVIRAGARGKPAQYRQTVFSPVVVSDAKGNPLTDFLIKNSYAEGLTIPEYLVSTFGARQGEVSKKLAVAEAGAFSKELSRASMTVKIEEHDCGTDHGIPVNTDDKDSVGAYLAKPVASYKKNNEVTSAMLGDLKNKKILSIIVRSPITCESSKHHHSGAVCQLCIGKREFKNLPSIGSYIGITSATTMGEPLAQGQLNVKHTSGAAGGPSIASGFKLIDRLANIPKMFPDKAPVAEKDGTITDIRVAPQGGHYIHQGITEYYIPAGFALKVKKGDVVEAGDILSEGIVNPAEIVEHKGIGEGRRYFAEAMKKAFDESGMGGINRRNFEVLAKAAIDHVRITNNDGLGDYLPNQVVSYQAIAKDYVPRHGSVMTRVDHAYDKYLEQPALHYTIGSRMTHRRIESLKNHGIESILVNDKKPDFEPEMQRLKDVPMHEHDWMHQLYSTNLERRLVAAVNTGSTSSLKGPSPIAGLAYGKDFGDKKAEEEESPDDKLSFE